MACTSCDDCTGITLPQGLQGPTGPTGPAGTNGSNGTNGVDGEVLVDTIFSRESTSATGGLSEIDSVAIDINDIFNATGDGLEFEVIMSYNYVSSTHGGTAALHFEDGVNSIQLRSAGLGLGIEAVVFTGTIIRASASAINYNITVAQPASSVYSSPTNTVGPVVERGTIYTTTNPGTINNNSASLKLAAKGVLNAGTNSIKVEFFKVKSLKKLT